MGKVVFNNSVSLDGFVAGPNDSPDKPLGEGGESLFKWYSSGDVAYKMAGNVPDFKVSAASARHIKEMNAAIGAMVAGRRMFDLSNAWEGNPPGEWPCFIVTHSAPRQWEKPGSPFTFVTDGVERAIRQAQAAAGDKAVAVSSASIAQQCLMAGLLDEIHIDLAPCLLGGGVRLFDHLGNKPIELEPIGVIEGQGVTHLSFRVVK